MLSCTASLVTLLVAVRASSGASDPSPTLRYFSTRTAYEVVRNKRAADAEDAVPGCRVEQVYMVIRHGTRFAGRDETDAMRSVLPALQAQILAAPHAGSLSAEELAGLAAWRMRLDARELSLAPAGEAELFELGRRLRRRVPRLLHSVRPKPGELEMRCTDMTRSVLSAKSFLRGFLNFSGAAPDHVLSSHIELVPERDDRLLLFADLCQKYIRSRLDQEDVGRLQLRRFDESPVIPRIVHLISRKTGLPEQQLNFSVVRALYEACRFEFAVLQGAAPWCAVFLPEALQLLEFRQDLKYYWRYGHGQAVNYQPSCLLLQDILSKFRERVDGTPASRRAVFRMTHSRTLLPLVTRLGLFNDSLPLLADNFRLHARRQWRLSRINPFAANVEFRLHSCQNSRFYVRTFVNEREVRLPGCASTWCPLEALRRAWRPVVSTCDFDALCEHGVRAHIALDDVAQALHTADSVDATCDEAHDEPCKGPAWKPPHR